MPKREIWKYWAVIRISGEKQDRVVYDTIDVNEFPQHVHTQLEAKYGKIVKLTCKLVEEVEA